MKCKSSLLILVSSSSLHVTCVVESMFLLKQINYFNLSDFESLQYFKATSMKKYYPNNSKCQIKFERCKNMLTIS